MLAATDLLMTLYREHNVLSLQVKDVDPPAWFVECFNAEALLTDICVPAAGDWAHQSMAPWLVPDGAVESRIKFNTRLGFTTDPANTRWPDDNCSIGAHAWTVYVREGTTTPIATGTSLNATITYPSIPLAAFGVGQEFRSNPITVPLLERLIAACEGAE